jgi:hypothetical protein
VSPKIWAIYALEPSSTGRKFAQSGHPKPRPFYFGRLEQRDFQQRSRRQGGKAEVGAVQWLLSNAFLSFEICKSDFLENVT